MGIIGPGSSVGPFIVPVFGEKIENYGGTELTVAFRIEGQRVVGRGVAKVKAAQTYAAGEVLLTLPVGMWPAGPLEPNFYTGLSTATLYAVNVNPANGHVVMGAPATLSAGAPIYLEPFNFSLT